MMKLRSGRLTGTRGILRSKEWELYIKPSEQKEAQAMLRGEIPIQLDPREMRKWLSDPNRDDRPSPQDVALARTMCIAGGVYRGCSDDMSAALTKAYVWGINSNICDISQPLP